MNPLFPTDPNQPQPGQPGYVLDRSSGHIITPPSRKGESPEEKSAAVELIRRKLDTLFESEPDAAAEIQEVEAQPPKVRSRHQQFMHELSASGKSLAQIQTEWHAYYVALPDKDKHEIWQEFYEHNSRNPSSYGRFINKQEAAKPAATTPPPEMPHTMFEQSGTGQVIVAEHAPSIPAPKPRSGAALRKQVLDKVKLSNSAQKKAKQHLHSLLFGISTGALVILIFLFSFFNEMIIAPFIQPSRHVSATPIILTADSVAPSETPEVIIPKINVQIPVIYDELSVDEPAVQRALERGVLHYPSTVLPGEKGNTAVFGHSSNNIFNKGKYKFAFVKLNDLVPGDIFYLTYGKKVFAYKVYDKRVVEPDQVAVLNSVTDRLATATLITCDPPGTSSHRLVVWGEQISPDPLGAAAPSVTQTVDNTPSQISGNGPSMWSRFTGWLF